MAKSRPATLYGDGVDDLLIGAISAGPGQRGSVFVVFGGSDVGNSGLIELGELSGSDGFVFRGIAELDGAGSAIAVGDIDGDGQDDAIIGASNADPLGKEGAGEVYVVYGPLSPFDAEYPLVQLLPTAGGDGSAGFVLQGIDPEDELGNNFGRFGDVNGDGYTDMLLDGSDADPDGQSTAGEAYLVYGGPSLGPVIEISSLSGPDGFRMEGIAERDQTAVSSSIVGDINEDGYPDIAVGALGVDSVSVDAGAVYVVFGGESISSDGLIELAELDGDIGFTVAGLPIEAVGSGVAGNGDLNADGIADLVVGAMTAAPGGVPSAGRAYVLFGHADIGASGAVDIIADGNAGFALNGVDVADQVGVVIDMGGDVNGDGVDDLILGARDHNQPGRNDAGAAYVVFGRSDTDADAVVDSLDNCLLVSNPLQEDSDSDGFGNACDPDLNNDLTVDFQDLALLKALFFGTAPIADFDGNGLVDFPDLQIMKSLFLRPPGPSGTTPLE